MSCKKTIINHKGNLEQSFIVVLSHCKILQQKGRGNLPMRHSTADIVMLRKNLIFSLYVTYFPYKTSFNLMYKIA